MGKLSRHIKEHQQIKVTSFGSNIVYAGAGSGFATIQLAIDAITDASITNEYVVHVLGGNYAPFDLSASNYITVKGSGSITVIETSSNVDCKFAGYRNAIKDMKLTFTDNGGAASIQYAIAITGQYAEATFDGLEFDIVLDDPLRTATVYAIGGSNRSLPAENTATWGAKVINCHGVSDGSMFRIGSSATVDYFNNSVFLTTRQGVNAPNGIDHIGVDVIGSGRTFWWSGRITSGYLFGNILDNGGNVYGFNISSIDNNCRLNIHDCDGILRNDDAGANESVYLNIPNAVGLNMEVRLNGFRGQTEGNGLKRSIRTFFTPTVGGRVIAMSGSMLNECEGNISGGTYAIDSTWDGWNAFYRDVSMGGLWLCDTATAAFQINMPIFVGRIQNVPLVIMNAFGSLNNLTVGQGTGAPVFDVVGVGAGQTSVILATGESKTFKALPNGNWLVY